MGNRLADDLALRSRELLAALETTVERAIPVPACGRIAQVVGQRLQATGIQPRIGELCELVTPGAPTLWAEVVGLEPQHCLLTPLGPTTGLSAATEVRPTGHGHEGPVGEGLLGRVIDALGTPVDGRGPLAAAAHWPVQRPPVDPLRRRRVDTALPTGVRSIDALLTLGVGQRIGLFAPPGVGKSTLLGMLARGASAEVVVVALVGERGREVREFLEDSLGEAGLARAVVVVATSDRPALERVRCAQLATTVAEWFREQGRSVLLLVDSLTRLARAQREIGLALGEPPTRRSYPPSIFSLLPQLLERAGQGERGAITAAYTVLTEGEDDNDPIAEELRSILDGHIVLTSALAAADHFPAIDVLASTSRVMPRVAGAAHRRAAARARALIARQREIELLVQLGEYRAGHDALSDAALAAQPALRALLRQTADEHAGFEATLAALDAAVAGGAAA